MKDVGLMNYFIGMEVWQGDEELFDFEGKYANEILKKFHMESNKPMETPLIGNWRNLVKPWLRKPNFIGRNLNTCVEIAQRHQSIWSLVQTDKGSEAQGFVDENLTRIPFDGKSTSGGIFIIGSTTISWYKRKQRSVALSSTEVEYMDDSQEYCEAI
eukprot:PITA_20434